MRIWKMAVFAEEQSKDHNAQCRIDELPIQDACNIRKGDFFRLNGGVWRIAEAPICMKHDGECVDVRCTPETIPLFNGDIAERLVRKLTAISVAAANAQSLPKTNERLAVLNKAAELLDLAHSALKSIR